MSNGRLQIWITLLSLGVVVSFMVSAFVIREQRDIGRESRQRVCALADRNADAIRAILVNIRQRVAGSAATPEDRVEAFEFYTRQIALVQQVNCEAIANP